MKYNLINHFLSIQVDEFGAELTSIYNLSTNKEYLWNADPSYWKRHSPILFPFVGSLNNKSFLYHGKIYKASQHGFARDKNFHLFKQTDNELWFFLEADEDTLSSYPFLFRLEIGYQLKDKTITVFWRVINQDQKEMYFSIGAHPAFHCPLNPQESNTAYFIQFDQHRPLHYLRINDSGLVVKKAVEEQAQLITNQGVLPYDPHLFDQDALIFEGSQCQQISILDPLKRPYITVTFQAPLFGLWSPAGKNAPFLCIEPWYGRCDAEAFEGALQEREWGNTLQAGEVFEAAYTIDID